MAPEVERALRARYAVDDPGRYFLQYLAGACRLDFGPSFQYRDWTCTQIIADGLGPSLLLGFLAVQLAILIGVPVGVLGASKPGGILDRFGMVLVLAGIALPSFVTGSILLTLLVVYWPVLPVGGWGSVGHLPLPVIALALPIAAQIARLTRAGMLDAVHSEFTRTAKAKGVPDHRIIWRHAFPVAALPVLGFIGPAAAQALTGSFVVEKIFNVPGIGQHFVNAARNLDRGLILAVVLVYAALLIALNLIVDISYRLADPRIEAGP